MRRVLLTAAALFLGLFLLLPGGLWWLIATESGNGVLIAQLAPLIGAELRIGERRGDIAGELEWRDLHYEDASVRVDLAHLVLRWSPSQLWQRRVSVQDLAAEGLSVRLKAQTAPSPPSSAPPPTRLPLALAIEHLSISDAQVWRVAADAPIAVSRAELVGQWIGNRVRITRLAGVYAPVGAIDLSAEGRLTATGVDLTSFALRAPAAVTAKGFVGYQSASDLQLAWQNLRWPLATGAQAQDAPLPLASSAEGQARLKGPWSDLQFELAAALGDHGHLQVQGRWNGELDAKAQWTDLAWPLVMPAGQPAPWQSARGALALHGLPAAYRFDLDAALLAQAQARSGQIRARGAGTQDSVDLQALQLAVGTASLEAAGQLAWAPQPAGALHGSLHHLDPSLFAADWPGDISGDFAVDGGLKAGAPISDPALRFTIALKDSRLRNYPLKLDAAGRFARRALDIDSFVLRSGGSELTASGRATEPYDLQARLGSSNLAELAPGLAGAVQAQARFRGRPQAPQLTLDAQIDHAAWNEYALAHLGIKTDLDWNGALSLDLEGRELSVGTLIQTFSAKGSGSRGDHHVDLAAALGGLQVEAGLAGGWNAAQMRWDGQLSSSRVVAADLAPWTLQAPAPLMLSAARNDLGSACWADAPGRVCAEVHQAPAATQARLQIERFAFASLRALLPKNLKLEGELAGEASAEIAGGSLRQARADLTTTAGSLQVENRRFGFKPAHLALSDSQQEGHVELSLPLDVGGIDGEAQLAPGAQLLQRGLSGELRVNFPDLAFLSVLSSEVSAVSGALSGHYALSGRVGEPELQGEVRLSNGHMKLTRPGIELTDLSAVIAGLPGGDVHADVQAKSGGGTLTVAAQVLKGPLAVEPVSGSPAPNRRSGVADAPVARPNANTSVSQGPAAAPSAQPPPPDVLPTENDQGLKLVVQVDGSDFQIANLPQARVWASPSLRYTQSGQQASFKGQLKIPRADIELKQGENTGVAPSSDQVIVDASGRAPEPSETIRIASEVRLELGEKVHLEGYGLKTRLVGQITAVDQPGRDTIGYGEIRLEDGQYKAYGQDLAIETGKLLFNGGPVTKPGLEIRAQHKLTDDVTVGIYVRGSLERPQLQLYSDPTMTQQQQLSWLLFGHGLDQTSSSADRSQLTGAAMALGLGGGSLLAQNFQKGLGLDQISLGADPGDTTQQARLTVGKYLSPKIFVSYGIGLFQPGQVFKLLYDLGRGFKLSTESGTYTGGDLLYSVERR